MPKRYPSFFPQRINNRVPSMAYVGGVETTEIISFAYPAVIVGDTIATAGSLLNALDTTAAGSSSTFAAAYTAAETQMSPWGRCITMVASGAATNTVTVTGRDYLGGRMTETLTMNGTTAVVGNKAFRYVDLISWTAAAVTVNIGLAGTVGVPYKCTSLVDETRDGGAPAGAGAFVPGLATATASTATTVDVRGRYAPVGGFNGSRILQLRCSVDVANLHGNAQYVA